MEIAARQDHAIFKHKNRLDDTGDPARSLQVSDIRFDRPYPNRAGGRSTDPKDSGDRARLDRIACLCARAVSLDDLSLAWVQTCPDIHVSNQSFLGGSTGECDSSCAAVLVRARCADDCSDGVLITQCVGQRFKDEAANGFAASIPIGLLVEGVAPSVWGEEPITSPSISLSSLSLHDRHTSSCS